MDRDKSIIAQNAGTTAANVMGNYNSQVHGPLGDYLSTYQAVREFVFNGTLELAGAEVVVEAFSGTAPAPAPAQNPYPQQAPAGPPATSGGTIGAFVVNSGKYAGKTFDQIAVENAGWFTWAAANLNNPFLKGKVGEYLSANPHLQNAA